MKRQFPMTIKQVKMMITGEIELKEFQASNPPHMILCGFVVNYKNNTEFTIFDGTEEMLIKLENPIPESSENVDVGSLLKVVCFSTKIDRCRPMIAYQCPHGEQLLTHFARCVQVSSEGVKVEQDYDMAYFMPDTRFG